MEPKALDLIPDASFTMSKVVHAWRRGGQLLCSLADIEPVSKNQLVWCNPASITTVTTYHPKRFARYLVDGQDEDSEAIKLHRQFFYLCGDWDRHVRPLRDLSIYDRSMRHFEEGKTWAESGEISWMLSNIEAHGRQDGCASISDVHARCANLDRLYASAGRVRELTPQHALFPHRCPIGCEKGGINVAISRTGELIFMGAGAHRLAIAKALHLECIPANLVMVHVRALLNRKVFSNISLTKPDRVDACKA
jgi:hypothetical protein